MSVYDKEGAAQYLKVGVRTIERLMQRNELAYSLVGGQVRFKESFLEDLLEQKKRKTTAELKAEANKRPRR